MGSSSSVSMPMRQRLSPISRRNRAAASGTPPNRARCTPWLTACGSRPSVIRRSRANATGSNAAASTASGDDPSSGFSESAAGPGRERSAATPPPAVTTTSVWPGEARKCNVGAGSPLSAVRASPNASETDTARRPAAASIVSTASSRREGSAASVARRVPSGSV